MRQILILIFLFAILVSICSANISHHHRNRKRIYQRHKTHPITRIRKIHIRSERKAEECQKHEHHLICGPERHCDKTCENLFSPPHCVNPIYHAKCYFPRCVCNDGYVRNSAGTCVKPSNCPNTYYEPASISNNRFENDMMIEFKPVKFSRIGSHRIQRISKRNRKHLPPTFTNKI